jgi:CubicO group peptidase (beta-lactamase class C family)
VLAAQTDLRKQTLTVYHLLTMTAGFDWPEFGEWHYFAPMAYQADICRFVLNRPLSTMPGTAMNYNSGCSHLLAAILQQTAGVAVDEFAKEVLFKPLGITNFRWYADHQGINKGADGLRLTAVDMARFGSLYLHQGRFGSQQIISPDWIRASTTACFTTYPNIGSYSYHWWVAHSQSDHESPFFFALGFGGQYIFVVPKRKIVAVFTSELYTNTLRPLELFRTCVLN